VKALGVVGGGRPPDVLVAAAVDDRDPRLRCEAIRALGSFDSTRSVDLLVEASAGSDRETALCAAEPLVALSGKEQAGPAATDALARSSSWSVDYARTLAELAA
jgi:HEAT repeats